LTETQKNTNLLTGTVMMNEMTSRAIKEIVGLLNSLILATEKKKMFVQDICHTIGSEKMGELFEKGKETLGEKFGLWLITDNPSLGGVSPVERVCTDRGGFKAVMEVLSKIEYGGVA
jgi:hypothetical protein